MFWIKKKVPLTVYDKFIAAQNQNTQSTVSVIQAHEERIDRLTKYIALLVQVNTPSAPESFRRMQDGDDVLTHETIKGLLGYGE